jgi:hypothetical protein
VTTHDVDHIVAWLTVLFCAPFLVVLPTVVVVIYVDRYRTAQRNLRLERERARSRR